MILIPTMVLRDGSVWVDPADPSIVDTDTANAFESDNNSSGTELTPVTKAIFSNISAFGASKDQTTWTGNPQTTRMERRCASAGQPAVDLQLFVPGMGQGGKAGILVYAPCGIIG
jgi:hypothetical protein